MNTRIINDIKYISLANENHFKKKSFEDNVYFTLRDIAMNIAGLDYFMEAKIFELKLANEIYYDERTKDFKYSNVLNDKNYIFRLIYWLSHISKSDFEFEPLNENANKEEKEWYYEQDNLLFPFDDWWSQFENLKNIILEHEKCLKFELEK